MDKYGHISVSSKRLKIARRIKRLTLKDLAKIFKVEISTIQKWQNRSIPDKAIIAVCKLFEVNDWVFLDEFLSDEYFEEIISNPALQKKYHPYVRTKNTGLPRWITSYKAEYLDPKKGTLSHSPIFHISSKTVLIRTRLWNVKGADYIKISFNEKDHAKKYLKKYGVKCSAMIPPDPEINIWTSENTKPSDVKIEDNYIHNVKAGDYHLSVYCKYKAEVSIYEIEKFPDIKKTKSNKRQS
jgi:transcriptional regulator with XRE-family HTH domain